MKKPLKGLHSLSRCRGAGAERLHREAAVNWSTHALSLSAGPRRINNDSTQTDQWDPSIATNPVGIELFVGYYSRQDDPGHNSQIMAYGAKAYITNGLAETTFDHFQVSPTAFAPLFAGTEATSNNVYTFEPIWPAAGACIDTNDVYQGPYDGVHPCLGDLDNPFAIGTGGEYANFCADDYTWSASDSNYFYFAWCDRTRVYHNTRQDADIKFARIKQ